jgi:hypothetical protein
MRRKNKTEKQERQEALLTELLANDAKYHRKSIEATVECAVNIKRAKSELIGENFEKFTKRMRHDPSAVSIYIKIAENRHITNKENWKHLPCHYSVLVIIARFTMDMTPADFDQLIKSKKIHPAITRSGACELAGLKPKAARKPHLTPTPTPFRTALVAANVADHMDAAEYLAKMPQPADTSTLIARAPGSAVANNLDYMRKGPEVPATTEPESNGAPTNDETVGTQDSDDIDTDNDVCIRQALRDKYDALSLEIVERKIYMVLRECGLRDVRVILAVYN